MNTAGLQALIFDVDGTLADTELAHLAAFNAAFAQENLPWRWGVPLYTELLEVSGGKERITHYWRQVQPDLKIIDKAAFTDTVQRIHDQKTAVYERMVNDGAVQLRPGVLKLIEQAHDAGLTGHCHDDLTGQYFHTFAHLHRAGLVEFFCGD